jgi:hypothetical protein
MGELFVRTSVAGSVRVRLSDGTSHTGTAEVAAPVEVAGPWRVEFPPDRGAPATIELAHLESWTALADPGVKYFSGAAIYRSVVELTVKPRLMSLDLGDVQVMAEVWVNGRNLGVLWKPPFLLDIAGALKQGRNALEVRVTNLWPNRLIGDEQFPDDVTWMDHGLYPAAWPDWLTGSSKRTSRRITFSTRRIFHKGDPLTPSGLLGPVRLISQADVPLTMPQASQRGD